MVKFYPPRNKRPKSGFFKQLVAFICNRRFAGHKHISNVCKSQTLFRILLNHNYGFAVLVLQIRQNFEHHINEPWHSGALTAGVVKESDDQNRGSILAAYSMFGFIGSIIGPPIVGFVLDWSGGLESYAAWKWGLIAMAAGSFAVFIVQNTLSKNLR